MTTTLSSNTFFANETAIFQYFFLANFIQKNILVDSCYSEFQFKVFHSLAFLPKSENIPVSLIVIERNMTNNIKPSMFDILLITHYSTQKP